MSMDKIQDLYTDVAVFLTHRSSCITRSNPFNLCDCGYSTSLAALQQLKEEALNVRRRVL